MMGRSITEGGSLREHGLSLAIAEELKEISDTFTLGRPSGTPHVNSFEEPRHSHGSLEPLLNGSELDNVKKGNDAVYRSQTKFDVPHDSTSSQEATVGSVSNDLERPEVDHFSTDPVDDDNRSMAEWWRGRTLDGETGDHNGLDISVPTTTSSSTQKQRDSRRIAGDETSKNKKMWKKRMRERLLNADSHWNFSVPWANAYNASYMKSSSWFQLLLSYTRTFDPSEPVITVCADTSFIDGLLNWLISALVLQKHPPKNILIVTNQAKVCSFLSAHKVPVGCLKLFSKSVLNGAGMKQVKGHKFSQLLVIRMSVMRILNHFGYDVLNMDTDAIMLKNIIPVFELNRDSDVVGTFGGHLPKQIFYKWGLVLCMGTILIRSTPATGMIR